MWGELGTQRCNPMLAETSWSCATPACGKVGTQVNTPAPGIPVPSTLPLGWSHAQPFASLIPPTSVPAQPCVPAGAVPAAGAPVGLGLTLRSG